MVRDITHPKIISCGSAVNTIKISRLLFAELHTNAHPHAVRGEGTLALQSHALENQGTPGGCLLPPCPARFSLLSQTLSPSSPRWMPPAVPSCHLPSPPRQVKDSSRKSAPGTIAACYGHWEKVSPRGGKGHGTRAENSIRRGFGSWLTQFYWACTHIFYSRAFNFQVCFCGGTTSRAENLPSLPPLPKTNFRFPFQGMGRSEMN